MASSNISSNGRVGLGVQCPLPLLAQNTLLIF
eukprot:CAMPEP_0184411166 /NCGR_PEP_ID=MMETSP0738-20130409/5433_1 /TAXON_ID=385413 /ORGANISM="Thalassiosira miniscula, Strain CCMP1093" /LENGTH=31 /DNA_ID= /DNA_START= /DNA_END= /DNA_ORIENTATION=